MTARHESSPVDHLSRQPKDRVDEPLPSYYFASHVSTGRSTQIWTRGTSDPLTQSWIYVLHAGRIIRLKTEWVRHSARVLYEKLLRGPRSDVSSANDAAGLSSQRVAHVARLAPVIPLRVSLWSSRCAATTGTPNAQPNSPGTRVPFGEQQLELRSL